MSAAIVITNLLRRDFAMINANDLKNFIVNKEITIARQTLEHYSNIETRWINNEQIETVRDTSFIANKTLAVLNAMEDIMRKVDEMNKKNKNKGSK